MSKRLISLMLITAFGTFPACAPVAPLIIEHPIGPSGTNISASGTGTRAVYSQVEALPYDPEYAAHTPYTILSPQGSLIQRVDNRTGAPAAWEPTAVALQPGWYRVVARAPNYGTVSLLAVVEAGRRTVIDLNEEVLPPRHTRGEKWVRLPSGQIIGSRAD